MNASRRVRRRPLSYWLSILLFGIVAAGLAGFFWLGTMRQDTSPVTTTRTTPVKSVKARREMVARDLILEGRDDEGDPYHIEAVRSRRPDDDRDTLILEDAIGRIDNPSGVPTHFEADILVYNQQSRLAELRGDVVIEKPDKWTLIGPLAHVNTRDNTLWTNKPVDVTLDGGEVHAQGMRSYKNGRTVFTGPVHAIFEAASDETTDEEAAEEEE